ncbi:MAG: hypothetical protein P0Y58_15225 [Candidatus Pseudomonas phytovorans]|uniref:Uncharacterized protein n=1 Tax=Candidatus Pseudomonas phytovorans TaxID=3121377 RepID=A0AAJ5WDD9_9PSED|nr:hypothetical protein [Pseudomonas sp.]WEK28261.1 MAG: hypothetical protein P0Y58_15225 [Pseudomonas sp.]
MTVSELAVFFVFSTFALDVSARGDGLSPDDDGEKVILRVKVPSELAAREVEALYRSTVCTSVAYDMDGNPYKRDGYRQLDVQSVREGDTNVLRTELPVDGGGRCRWRLSNVTFGIRYGETSQFGEGVVYGGGGGVIVLFDRSNSPGSGTAIKVEGDVDIRPDYYPWLSERFIGGYRKDASLATSRSPYIRYLALSARRVNFEPVLHSGYLVRSVGPKIQRKGDFAIFHYPDGSSSTDGWGEPSFRKLQEIRKAAELESAK